MKLLLVGFALGVTFTILISKYTFVTSIEYRGRIDGAARMLDLCNLAQDVGKNNPTFDSAFVEFAAFCGHNDWSSDGCKHGD